MTLLTPRPSTTTHGVVLLVQAALILIGCWFVFHRVDVNLLLEVFGRINPGFALLAIVPFVLERLVRPYRLAVLLGTSRTLDVIAAQNGSQLANLILPMRSGEVLLVVWLRGLQLVSGSAAFSIVLIDRVLDVLFVLAIFAIAVIMIPSLPKSLERGAVVLAATCSLGVCGIVILLSFKSKFLAFLRRVLTNPGSPRGESWIRRIELVIEGFRVLGAPLRLSVALIVTAATWGLATLAVWLSMRSLWLDAPIGAAALSVCAGVIGVSLISVPAGVGVMHAAFALSAGLFGASQEIGLAFAVLAHFLATATTLVIGLVSLKVVGSVGLKSLWQKAWG